MNGKDYISDNEYKDVLAKVRKWAGKRNIRDIDDLVHDAYLRYVSCDYRSEVSLPWWFTVVQNLFYRRHSNDKRILDPERNRKIIAKQESKDWAAIDEEYRNLRARMDKELPDFVRDIALLTYLNGLTYEQVGEIMNCNKYKVNNWLHRGLKEFKRDQQNQA